LPVISFLPLSQVTNFVSTTESIEQHILTYSFPKQQQSPHAMPEFLSGYGGGMPISALLSSGMSDGFQGSSMQHQHQHGHGGGPGGGMN
jgi:hypothetical protein